MLVAYEDSQRRLTVAGNFDEQSDFASAARRLPAEGDVQVDLAGVERINSLGSREWVKFVRALPPELRLILERCPPMFVQQLNMIAGFAERSRVKSIFIPYVCEACGHDRLELWEVGSTLPQSVAPCEKCGEPMTADVVEDDYFEFARRG